MKEIIYIQAGKLSNYTGTHFWNTQECYIPYDNPDDTEIEPAISFCENIDAQEISSLYPRLLIFDRKSDFGTLARRNVMGDEDVEAPALWSGDLVEYRQEQIPKSTYQEFMDEEQSEDAQPIETRNLKNLHPEAGDVRYWSDFSRVYYLPRSLQKIPDPPDWETTSVDWNEGQELFKRYNEETDLMDGALRLFAEDCDNLQGVQIMNDTDTFGSFMSCFLASFRDEYLKLPSFCFPVVSGVGSQSPECDDVKATRKIMNEAFCLRSLNESSSMNVLIQEPTSWPASMWDGPLGYPSGSVYHQSAVLSAHVETCTLPFRLKRGKQDIASVCGQLNWRNVSPFGELSGVFPLTGLADLDDRVVNLSSNLSLKSSNRYSQIDVTRGFSSTQIEGYEKWSAANRPTNILYTASIHGPLYPLPSSFPLPRQENGAEPLPRTTSGVPAVDVYSSLSMSSNIATTLERYALFIDKSVKRRTTSIASIDVSMDDLKDLANDLWTMHDTCSEEQEDIST